MDPVAQSIRECLNEFSKRPEQPAAYVVAGRHFRATESLSKFFHLPVGKIIKNLLDISTSTFENPVNQPCKQPAVEFERQHNLSGIAGKYHLPEGVTAHDLQTYAQIISNDRDTGRLSKEQALGRLNEVTEALVGRNPSLEGMSYERDSFRENAYIVHGVASAFNAADIQAFLNYTRPITGTIPEPQASQLEKSVAAKLGINGFSWRLSPSTLQTLDRQVSPDLKMTPQSTAAPATPKPAALMAPSPRAGR